MWFGTATSSGLAGSYSGGPCIGNVLWEGGHSAALCFFLLETEGRRREGGPRATHFFCGSLLLNPGDGLRRTLTVMAVVLVAVFGGPFGERHVVFIIITLYVAAFFFMLHIHTPTPGRMQRRSSLVCAWRAKKSPAHTGIINRLIWLPLRRWTEEVRREERRSKLGHSGSCESEMSQCCLMEFSAAPLWESWHAVSPLPDGGPLGSCFRGGSFCSTSGLVLGNITAISMQAKCRGPPEWIPGTCAPWTHCQEFCQWAGSSQGTRNKSILYHVCRHSNPRACVLYLTTPGDVTVY